MVSILNLKQTKPQNKWDVKVDRSSILGNPFRMESESKRNDTCERYNDYFRKQAASNPNFKLELDRLTAYPIHP
jgi:hypothetical protein